MKPGAADGHRRDDADAGEAALDWAIRTGTANRVIREVGGGGRRPKRKRTGGLALAVAALLVSGSIWQVAFRSRDERGPTPSPETPRAARVVSYPLKRTLPDGSSMELRDGADIAVEFSDEIRRVILRQGGAHFDVTKDPLRRFVVVAQEVEVQAVGTSFSMLLESSRVEVLVTEGRVAVEKIQSASADSRADRETARPAQPKRDLPPALVDAGHRVVVELAAPMVSPPAVEPVTPEQIKDRLSWRVPRLELSGAYLEDVIPLFNAHGSDRILLSDPAVGRVQLSGALRADNSDSLFHLLELEFGIRAVRRAGNEVLLMPAERRSR